jgi:hypothetical protein
MDIVSCVCTYTADTEYSNSNSSDLGRTLGRLPIHFWVSLSQCNLPSRYLTKESSDQALSASVKHSIALHRWWSNYRLPPLGKFAELLTGAVTDRDSIIDDVEGDLVVCEGNRGN